MFASFLAMFSGCTLPRFFRPPTESKFTLEQARENIADGVDFSITSTKDLDNNFWHTYTRHANSFEVQVRERVEREGSPFPMNYTRLQERFVFDYGITTRYAIGCCNAATHFGLGGWCYKIQDKPVLADYHPCFETIFAIFNLDWLYDSSSTFYVDSIHTNIVTRTYKLENDVTITRANGDVHISQGTTITTSRSSVFLGALGSLIPTTVGFSASSQLSAPLRIAQCIGN